ncbi:MAG: adenylosuccinate lyase [SAR202 cluster bacterium]|nr:adenylosuccinate lyase [SAR202 cluster bacterium]
MIERYSRPAMKRVWSDENKYDTWLAVELAAVEAWAAEGVVPKADAAKLRSAAHDLGRLQDILKRTKHDMTAFLGSITERLGPEGRWLHHGLTTSDVWDTATSLQLRQAAAILDEDVARVIEGLGARALKHKDDLMMGRTHGVHAEPITFGLKLAVWWDEMRRHKARLAEAAKGIAVGKLSGPVGSHATVPPSVEERVCAKLGLAVAPLSSQVLQRDRHAHFIVTLALIAASLEKFATEIRALQRTEIREVEEPFGEGQTGSSSMPHKRNPELSERICGLARLVRGHSVTALENVALWGERDISHSSAERLILPDSCLALDYMLDLFAGIVEGMRAYPDRMRKNLESSNGAFFSQRLLLSMVEHGFAREEAYKLVQVLSMRAFDEGVHLRELASANAKVREVLSRAELAGVFDETHYVRHVDEVFRRAGLLPAIQRKTSKAQR